MNWELLFDRAGLASVLPDVYAHYRGPLLGALGVFLQGLPAVRQEAIAIEQAALPPEASASERLMLLARSCPVLHKLGQTLARDRNLSAELRGYLQRLESLPPSVPLESVGRVLRRELGPLERLGITLVPPALAEASVAIVIPFHFAGGEAFENGVFKVLKPGIEERLEQELELLKRVGAYLDQKCDDFLIPQLDYRHSFEQVRDKLFHEIRLDKEQRNLSLARDFYGNDPRILIPLLFDFCTSRITAMERVVGQKVTECSPASWTGKRRLARRVIESLIARPIFSGAARAPFHGDPHAGNLFFTQDGRLAILDWSLIGWLGEEERVALMQIILGAIALRTDRIVSVLSRFSKWRSVDLSALEAVVHEWIKRMRYGQLPGFTWLMGLLDEAVRSARLRFGADLMLFRKSLHMVEGLVADIAGGSRLTDQVLMNEFVLHFLTEWPWRFLTSPDSRAFATRVSNTDLAELVLGLPSSVSRFWLDQDHDMVG